MQMRTFTANTMAEALRQLKDAMGGDAVIMHTRTYERRRWWGSKQAVVEITGGYGMPVAPRPVRPKPVAAPARAAAPRAAVAAAPRTVEQNCRDLLKTPAAADAMVRGLTDQVGELRTIINDLVRETRAQKAPSIPEEVFDHYLNLIQNQVAEELAGDVVKDLRKSLRPEHFRNPEFVREKLAEQIERMLPVSGPIQRTKKVGPHVVALIGPTGVGKTTTIAKLAANLSLRDGHKVGLITIDTYRIAAVEQLKKYADIIGSALRVVTTPEDLRQAIESMGDCEFVLIDTAGRSPSDTLKLNELKNFLAAANPDEVHLVLASTASQCCIEKAIQRFSEVRVDKIIFTKLDEAVHVGMVLNVVRKVNKSLSYITTGQDVPNDIEVGRGRRLAQLILGQSGPGSSI